MAERPPPAPGELLFEYAPARLGPMSVALLAVLAVATPLAALDRALSGRADEALLAAAPLLLVVLFGYLAAPGPLRIFTDAIEPARPRLARWAGARGRIALCDAENIYPSFYEDAGMRLSPFAAAEGTARHAGIRVETRAGERVMIAFTPTVLDLRRHGTAPYRAALEAVREACARAGRPLVTRPPELTQAQVDSMLVEAARPLLPFPLTVAGILAPAVVIPALVLGAGALWGPPPPAAALLLALLGLAPLLAVFAVVDRRGRRRATLLDEAQKFREHKRAGAPRG